MATKPNTIAILNPEKRAQTDTHPRTARLGCLLEEIDTLVDIAIDTDGEQGQLLLHAARELIALASSEVGKLQHEVPG